MPRLTSVYVTNHFIIIVNLDIYFALLLGQKKVFLGVPSVPRLITAFVINCFMTFIVN